jgi:hypothetical protein
MPLIEKNEHCYELFRHEHEQAVLTAISSVHDHRL